MQQVLHQQPNNPACDAFFHLTNKEEFERKTPQTFDHLSIESTIEYINKPLNS